MTEVKDSEKETLKVIRMRNKEDLKLMAAIEKNNLVDLVAHLKRKDLETDRHNLNLFLRVALSKIADLNEVNMMDVFLKNTVKMEGVSLFGNNALHRAVANSSLPIVKKMLEYGAEPLKKPHNNGVDAIVTALLNGRDLELIQTLWDGCPNINRIKRSRNYLVYASNGRREQDLKVAKFILDQGVKDQEIKMASDHARLVGAYEMSDFITGYQLSLQEKAQLNKSVQESATKPQKASSKTKKAVIRL